MPVGRKRHSCPLGNVGAHKDGLAAVVSDAALTAAVKAKTWEPVYADCLRITN